jgi:Protein of unknown function (DUF2924)
MNARLQVVPHAKPVDLDRLARMQPAELQRLHQKLFGSAVPCGNSELARRRIAWHVQAKAEGGVPESVRQHALAIAQESSLRIQLRRRVTDSLHKNATVSEIVSDHDSRLPMPGSIIVKEHRGKTIMVRVLDAGFEYDGRRFDSLSAIAKDITGTKWNGFVFFGLAKEGKRGR